MCKEKQKNLKYMNPISIPYLLTKWKEYYHWQNYWVYWSDYTRQEFAPDSSQAKVYFVAPFKQLCIFCFYI